MLMWTYVIVPQKKLPSGQHWMIYNLLKFACSVFQFDHHSAVQFLLRYLVHPNYNVSIPAIFSSKNHTWSSKMLRCSLFKVLTCCVQWICCIPKIVTVQVSRKQMNICLCIELSEILFCCHHFLELKVFFWYETTYIRMIWGGSLNWILSFLQCCSWEVERAWVLSRRLPEL